MRNLLYLFKCSLKRIHTYVYTHKRLPFHFYTTPVIFRSPVWFFFFYPTLFSLVMQHNERDAATVTLKRFCRWNCIFSIHAVNARYTVYFNSRKQQSTDISFKLARHVREVFLILIPVGNTDINKLIAHG